MAEKKIVVRKAEPRDVANVAKLLRKGWNEQIVEYAPIDEMKGHLWILSIIEDGVIAVADISGRIVGAAGASPFMPRWSTDWLLEMEFIYVDPNFRAYDVRKDLEKSITMFADKVDLPTTFGIQSGERVEAKDRMMQMSGWQYVGGNFLRLPSGKTESEDNEAELQPAE